MYAYVFIIMSFALEYLKELKIIYIINVNLLVWLRFGI
jgi:hypothetical protein